MADVVAFHSQVASIMEVLANAAVAEICKLADEGFALLRWEVNQREKENEELRRRISAMEKKELADVEEVVPGSPLVSKEKPKEELRRKENMWTGKERAVQPAPDGHQRTAFPYQQTALTDSAEDAGDELRSRCTVWEVSGLEDVLKAEPETDGVKQRPWRIASEHRAEQSSLLGASPNLWGVDSSCLADTDTGGSVVHTEVQLATGTKFRSSLVAAIDIKPEAANIDPVPIKLEVDIHPTCDNEMRTGDVQMSPKHCAEDGDAEELTTSLCPPHTQMVVRGCTAPALGPEARQHSGLGAGAQQHSGWDDAAPCSMVFPPPGSPRSMETIQRGFICKHCGKSFSHLKEFEEHRKVHSRGKVLNCVHCGKTFSQLSDLKVHLNIHVAKRPFPCARCGKSFMSSRDLKVHQNVHTGERPFCCTMCGRSFSHPSNLKRHQKRSGSRKCVLSVV